MPKITHRTLCHQIAKYLYGYYWCDIVGYEVAYNKGFADVLGITIRSRIARPRIVVVEVKRTRADLLQDLRKRKLLKYERNSTHCYLAGTAEALNTRQLRTNRAVIQDLRALGLPDNWGILHITKSSKNDCKVIRDAQPMSLPSPKRLEDLTIQINRSLLSRLIKKD